MKNDICCPLCKNTDLIYVTKTTDYIYKRKNILIILINKILRLFKIYKSDVTDKKILINIKPIKGYECFHCYDNKTSERYFFIN